MVFKLVADLFIILNLKTWYGSALPHQQNHFVNHLKTAIDWKIQEATTQTNDLDQLHMY